MEEIIVFGLISDGDISLSVFLDLIRKIMCGVYETSFHFSLGWTEFKGARWALSI